MNLRHLATVIVLCTLCAMLAIANYNLRDKAKNAVTLNEMNVEVLSYVRDKLHDCEDKGTITLRNAWAGAIIYRSCSDPKHDGKSPCLYGKVQIKAECPSNSNQQCEED